MGKADPSDSFKCVSNGPVRKQKPQWVFQQWEVDVQCGLHRRWRNEKGQRGRGSNQGVAARSCCRRAPGFVCIASLSHIQSLTKSYRRGLEGLGLSHTWGWDGRGLSGYCPAGAGIAGAQKNWEDFPGSACTCTSEGEPFGWVLRMLESSRRLRPVAHPMVWGHCWKVRQRNRKGPTF